MTTTSDSAAIRLARSEKHWIPNGQRPGPRHSRAVTATCRHAWSGTPGTISSLSPVVVDAAHWCSRLMCAPSWLVGASNRESCSSSGPLRSLLRHR